jgi:hypothetical protein
MAFRRRPPFLKLKGDDSSRKVRRFLYDILMEERFRAHILVKRPFELEEEDGAQIRADYGQFRTATASEVDTLPRELSNLVIKDAGFIR